MTLHTPIRRRTQKLKQHFVLRKQPHRTAAPRWRPMLETLEERTLLDAGPLGEAASSRWIGNLYHDLLGRTPSTTELAAWSDDTHSLQTVARFLDSPEYRTRQIETNYWALLGRAPEDGIVDRWLDRMDAGLTQDGLVAALVASAEYGRHQGAGNAAWVAGLYRDVLGRGPDDGDFAWWTDSLDRRVVSRSFVAQTFVTSAERRALDAAAKYRVYLDREPDASDLAGLENASSRSVLSRVLLSAEYSQRTPATLFGPDTTDALVIDLREGADGAQSHIQAFAVAVGAALTPTLVDGVFKVTGDWDGLAKLASTFESQPFVRYIEPERRVQVQVNPNDPQYVSGGMYGLNGIWGIRGPQAWDLIHDSINPIGSGLGNVIVADIDTGVDYTHPDLYRNIWVNQGEIPDQWLALGGGAVHSPVFKSQVQDVDQDGLITFWDLNDPANTSLLDDNNGNGRRDAGDVLRPVSQGGWEDTVDGPDPRTLVDDIVGWNFHASATIPNHPLDDNGHGTHTAGTIGAIGNNNLLVTGVAWKTQIMVLKFLAASGSGTDLGGASAIQYAADLGARVSSNSWTGTGSSPLLENTIFGVRNQQIVVAAAGNSNQNQDALPVDSREYPAAGGQPNIISVASSNSGGGRSGFSNYGRTLVDLAAPGEGILSTTLGGGSGGSSGTSMATPHVAGVAVLLAARYPTWTVPDLIGRILSTTTPNAAWNGLTVTAGILNAAQALATATLDLNWSGGGITGPTQAPAGSPFTISRTYTVATAAATTDFAIAYYLSTNTTYGDTDDVVLGSETITAAAGKAVGPHAGSSPSFQIGTSGNYYLFTRIDTGNAITELVETNNVSSPAQPLAVTFSGSAILDNGQAGYTDVGGWATISGQGYGGSVRYAVPGDGSTTATWQVSGLLSGTYTAQATWTGFTNRATNTTYRVYDGATLRATVAVNQVPEPSGPTYGGRPFQTLADVAISSGTLRVVLDNLVNGQVIADAVRVSTAAAPVVDLSWSALTGPTTATTQTPFTLSRTYTVSGAAALTDFTIGYYASTNTTFGDGDDVLLGSEMLSAAADKAVGSHPGSSPSLQFSSPGTYYFFGRIDNSNALTETDEGNNVVQAPQQVVVTAPSAVILDNGQPGYTEVGTWGVGTAGGYNGSTRYAAAGNGSTTATWQLTGLASGSYAVQATWYGAANRATNATYQVFDGSTLRATVTVNQQPQPTGPTFGGRPFQDLASVAVNSGTLRIVLSNAANSFVIADAVRIAADAPPPPPSVDLSWSALTGPTTATTQTPFTLSRTYTVSGAAAPTDFTIGYYASINTTFGDGDDVLLGSETLTAAADKAVGSHPGTSPSLQFSIPGTYYFFGRIDNSNVLPETDEGNNVVQAPQQVVVTAPSAVILDNGQPGYTEVGTWGVGTAGGYNGSTRYAAAGNGSTTATWQLTGLASGSYAVQVTWYGAANRATNATYQVFDGSTLRATVTVNQQPQPTGPTFGGRPFQDLASVAVNSGTLRIVLSNAANSFVIADAVRVELLP